MMIKAKILLNLDRNEKACELFEKAVEEGIDPEEVKELQQCD
ncbi:MAG: hypothetical protein ACQESM_06860 [Bacteroidota bacterium]